MSHRPSVRAAFNVVELIIVILLVGILIALLLPAVEKVREAASANQCRNNLRQIAQGCSGYEDAHGHFPPGTVVGSAKAPHDRLSWMAEVLPHIEQDNVYKQLDCKQGWQSEANKKAVATVLKLFNCPSAMKSEPWVSTHTNYVGVAGRGIDAASLPLTDLRSGMFGHSRIVKVKDVKDGTSNTLLCIETRRETGFWAAGGRATVRGIDPEEDPPIGRDAPFGLHVPDRRYPFQKVKTYAIVAMADGSLTVKPERTDAAVLAALATIAGDEVVSYDW